MRGRGLLWGVQMRDAATAEAVVKRALRDGLILLQAGIDGDVISISPPLVITDRQLRRGTAILENAIAAHLANGRHETISHRRHRLAAGR